MGISEIEPQLHTLYVKLMVSAMRYSMSEMEFHAVQKAARIYMYFCFFLQILNTIGNW